MSIRLSVKDTKLGQTSEFALDPSSTVQQLKERVAAQKGVNAGLVRLYHQDELILDGELRLDQWGFKDGDQVSLAVASSPHGVNPLLEEAQLLIQRSQKNPDYLNKVVETDTEFAELLVSEDAKLVLEALKRKRGLLGPPHPAAPKPGAEPASRPTPPPPTDVSGGQNLNPWVAGPAPQRPGGALVPPQDFQFQAPLGGQARPNGYPQQAPAPAQPLGQLGAGGFGLDFDINAQRKIEEAINKNRIAQQAQHAYDHYPELFVQTQMLFIRGRVNKVDTEIFVDTGAQVTIVSKAFAERAGLMKDVDTRMRTQVRGVGSQIAVGKLYMMEMFIGDRVFILSATVLEKFDHDVLLGLDMMKRHKCVIDLGRNEIRFGLEQVVAGFLSDHEVSVMREKQDNELVARLQKATGLGTGDALKLLQQNDMDVQKAAEAFRGRR